MCSTQERKQEGIQGFPVLGWEQNSYFVLDLDKQTSLEETKAIAFEIGSKYLLGNCIVVLSSEAKQLTLDLKSLQNYNLIYGRKISWRYQQWVLKKLDESGILGDIRYIGFREQEKSSTIRVSPKNRSRSVGIPVAYIRITGENDGIEEYLFFLNIGRQVEKYLREEGLVK